MESYTLFQKNEGTLHALTWNISKTN
jgi:hypothetical protein